MSDSHPAVEGAPRPPPARCGPGGSSTPTDLDGVLQTEFVHLMEEAARAGVLIELDLACGAPILLGAERLHRVIHELARDALERMPSGGLLRVVSRRVGGHGCRVEIQTPGGSAPGIVLTLQLPLTVSATG